MEDSILMSINSYWCELIASGIKTIEARKTIPKIKPPFKCYIYCTRKGKLLEYYRRDADGSVQKCIKNGKIIGEFICDRIVNVLTHPDDSPEHMRYFKVAIEAACLSEEEVERYSSGKDVFGLHISNLVIYENPVPLEAFEYLCCGDCEDCKYSYYESRGQYFYDEPYLSCDAKIKSPPQSWCYCQVGDYSLLPHAPMFKEIADKIK